MNRKIIIEGNSVYEIDEECMLRRRKEEGKETTDQKKNPEHKGGESR